MSKNLNDSYMIKVVCMLLFFTSALMLIQHKYGVTIKCEGPRKYLNCTTIFEFDTSDKNIDSDGRVPEKIKKDIQSTLDELRKEKAAHPKKVNGIGNTVHAHDASDISHLKFLDLAHKLESLRIYANSHTFGYRPFVRIKSNLSPLDQFLIKDFLSFYFNIGFNVKFLFTNMSFYLVIITSLALTLNVIYNKLNMLISNT